MPADYLAVKAPVLVSPADGQEITDIAVHLKWRSDALAVGGYEVQLSETTDFCNPKTYHVPLLNADVSIWLPEDDADLPTEGTWHWRVRAAAPADRREPGGQPFISDWSESRSMRINSRHGQKSPIRKISREMPLFMLFTPGRKYIRSLWEIVPEYLKPYTSLRIMPAEEAPGYGTEQFMEDMARTGADITVQAAGPHYTVGGLYKIASLSEIEQSFRKYGNFRFVTLVEQYLGNREAAPWRWIYFKRLLMLCAKYGRILVLSDGNRYEFNWANLCGDAGRMEFIRKYKTWFVPVYKMNHSLSFGTSHGYMLGLWLAGYSENFGVQPEHWYWNDAGFRTMGRCGGYLQGIEQQFPPEMAGRMILTGLACGACVFPLENSFWFTEAYEEGKLRFNRGGRAIFDLFGKIVRQKLIPAREEVARRLRIAVETGPEDFGDTFDYGKFRSLFKVTYGIRHSYEIIPNTGRYFFIPLVPQKPAVPEWPGSIRRIPLSDCTGEDSVRSMFNEAYPRWYDGDAFAAETDNLVTIMNTHENENIAQYFRIPLWSAGGAGGKCCGTDRRNTGGQRGESGAVPDGSGEQSAADDAGFAAVELSGVVGPHGYLLLKRTERALALHANGLEDGFTHIYIHFTARPAVMALPGDASAISAAWDRETNVLELFAAHKNGPVNILFTKGADNGAGNAEAAKDCCGMLTVPLAEGNIPPVPEAAEMSSAVPVTEMSNPGAVVLPFSSLPEPEQANSGGINANGAAGLDYTESETVYLSDMDWLSVYTTGKALPCKDGSAAGIRFGDVPIKMTDVYYAKGLGLSTDTILEYGLDGRYERFIASAGMDDDIWMPIIRSREDIVWDRPVKQIAVVFAVYADEEEIFNSGPIYSSSVILELDLDVAGRRKLRLEARNAGADPASVFVNFANARLIGKKQPHES